jgi:adenosylhomocysteine nucleosidase
MHRSFTVLLLLCLVLPQGWGASQLEESYTALVTAYDPEIEELLGYLEALPDFELTGKREEKGVLYREGRLGDEPVVIFVTGMSIANAAMTMQMAIDQYPLERVLYSGIAGAVNSELQVGDVVVPERWYYHDESAYFNPSPGEEGTHVVADYFINTSRFYPKNRPDDPHIPDYDNYGMIYPDEVLVIKSGWDQPKEVSYFRVNGALLAAAREAVD